MDFLGCFPQQEQPAGDQDQVPPGKRRFEPRLAVRAGCARQSESNSGRWSVTIQPISMSSAMRMPSASVSPSRRALLAARGRQLVGQDGDEHQVVDPEYDLERDQG